MDSTIKNFDTPILFLVFNRPDVTKKVFSEIKKIKPSRLFIAADGPRDSKQGEHEKCKEVRRIVSEINWECEVETLFREKNLGCGRAVSGAITWFFEQVDMGIILEDDCLPNNSFFRYCEILLKKYATYENVGMIAGSNALSVWKSEYAYFFSHYAQIWGWATWKRAWEKYDFEMSSYNSSDVSDLKRTFQNNEMQTKAFKKIFDSYTTNPNKGYTWDYQWVYTIAKNNMYCITPTKNLIKNIGFGNDATHTSHNNQEDIKVYDLVFPLNFIENPTWEQKFDKALGIKFSWIIRKNHRYFIQRFKNLIHKIKNKIN